MLNKDYELNVEIANIDIILAATSNILLLQKNTHGDCHACKFGSTINRGPFLSLCM